MSPIIPADIWINVARFIPEEDLRCMLSINSTFFQLAMNARYHEIVFNDFHIAAKLKIIRRLRDPEIAYRVRRLCVYLDSFSNVTPKPYDPVDEDGSGAALNNRDRIIQILTDSVTFLTNVQYFYVSWSIAWLFVEDLLPLLTAAWNTFGSRVEQVDIYVPFHYFPAMIPPTDGPMELVNLDVSLCDPGGTPREQEERLESMTLAVNAWARLINRVAPTLRSLSLSSTVRDFEFSPLFLQLGNIPKLARLRISAEYDENIFSNVPGLRFLCNHAATLQHISWTNIDLKKTLEGEVSSRDGRSKEQRLMDWLSGNALDELFSNLVTLHLPVPASHTGLILVEQHLRRSVDSLTFLTLYNHIMTYEEVKSLASIFLPRRTGHLRELELRVEILSPDLVMLLSRAFPQLKTLGLDISYAATWNGGRKRKPRNETKMLSLAGKFAEAMRKCDIREWPLYEIKIKIRGDGMNLCGKLMILFAECVPSLQMLGGLDKEYFVRGAGRVFT